MNKFECYKSTNEDWCPNFEGDRVRVRLYTDMDHRGKKWHRVCVWGADDCGMEKDFKGEDSVKDAEDLYKLIISLPKVNRDNLKKLGFTNA